MFVYTAFSTFAAFSDSDWRVAAAFPSFAWADDRVHFSPHGTV
jgi:hypothetical protein